MDRKSLLEIKKEIEPKAKFWNQNSFFLAWGFSSAIFAMTGIELFRIFAKDYSFALEKLTFTDFYLNGILVFFIFFGILTYIIGKIIDKETKHYNKLLTWINKELK